MILKVYIACSILCLLLALMIAHVGKERFKTEHPYAKCKKINLSEKYLSTFRLIVLCFIPIFHLITIIGFLFYTEKILDEVMEKLENSIEMEGENNEIE